MISVSVRVGFWKISEFRFRFGSVFEISVRFFGFSVNRATPSIYFDDASLRFHEIFHCFMVLCFDFEDVNSFFMGISRRAYYYMHQFFQARFYCFESLRVLGRREELTMWPRHKKNWNIFSTSREYCILLICLTSWLHFLNKASTNTKEKYVRYLNIFCLANSVLLIRPC